MRKWARLFEVKENDSSKDKQSKKEGGGGLKPGTRTCLVQNGESETRTFPQNYAISINSDNACFMSYYYRDKIIAIICFCLTNSAITYRCAKK